MCGQCQQHNAMNRKDQGCGDLFTEDGAMVVAILPIRCACDISIKALHISEIPSAAEATPSE